MLHLDDIEQEGRGTGAWRIPPRRAFARSHVYEFVTRALTRYVLSQTLGRSFLVAGHRGAGKTALIEQVVYDLRWDAIEQVAAGEADPRALARPLLVKLHGPSLIAPVAEGTQAADARVTENTAQQALVQITLALYRALAEEAAAGFALHARTGAERRKGDDIELAGQLNLTLDLAPAPGELRQYWKRLGRLESGVLWPEPPLGRPILPPDQGVRELVALATAAQAFRVCAGTTTHEAEDTNSTELTQSITTEGSGDLRSAVNKLSALLVGGAVGGVLSAGGVSIAAAVGSALAAGFLTTFTFRWSDARSRSRKRSEIYTFIRDTTTPTLDRELPLAIQRIKAAGLTPVFVIDELDKVPDSADRVRALLSRLKHIVTDYGFFCFLTDRDCFEDMNLAVRRAAYPVEHTYFSDRLFITYAPGVLFRFLLQVIRPDEPQPSQRERTAQAIFALETLLLARPHFIDINRRLVRHCDEQGRLNLSQEQLFSPSRRLAAAFQLAILVVCGSGEAQVRTAEDPAFLQLLVDTLYWPVEVWESEAPDFRFDAGSLRARLLSRMAPGAQPADPSGPDLSHATVQFLVRCLEDLLSLLADLPALGRAAGAVEGLAEIDVRNLLPGFTNAIVRRGPGNSHQFAYNGRGQPQTDLTGPQLHPEAESPLRQGLALVEDFRLTIAKLGIPVDVLVELGLLPSALSTKGLKRLRFRLQQAVESGGDDIGDLLGQVDELRGALETHGDSLSSFMLLTLRVDALAKGGVPRPKETLRTILRLLAPADLREDLLPTYLTPPPLQLSAAPEALGQWRRHLRGWRRQCRTETTRPGQMPLSDGWAVWPQRLLSHFDANEHSPPIRLEELVAAARGEPPAALFQLPFEMMTIGDWSDLVLRFSEEATSAGWPDWTFVAALRALGAPSALQSTLLDGLPRFLNRPPTMTRPEQVANALIGAPPSGEQAGTLLLIRDDSSVPKWRPQVGTFVITIRQGDLLRYSAFIDWLGSQNTFHTVAYENDDEI